ncbi:hypothetical protein [Clostridium saccharoperbutylacetonicum]|uniref:hypothetical protein n=1 Tax=Clostridium saccharoperbutylacetonicum TaxID=36745 RepID=UPI0039ED9611
MKKNNETIASISFLITYEIVHIIYKVTGFYYSFNEGLINFKLLIDLGLWCIVNFIIFTFLKKIWTK